MIKSFVTCAHCGGQRDADRERCSGCGSSTLDQSRSLIDTAREAEADRLNNANGIFRPYQAFYFHELQLFGELNSNEALELAKRTAVNEVGSRMPGLKWISATGYTRMRPVPGFAGFLGREESYWEVVCTFQYEV